jgi:3-oxoacyl-[acyl-carrier protein] reductase
MELELMDVVSARVTLRSHGLIFRLLIIDYAASKGGLNSMMMNLSSHLAEFNISVNSVSPAMVGGTGMLPDESSVPGVVKTIPLGRLCKPVEVANVVSMFACSGFVTGQSLVIAGGLKHL